MAERHLQHTDLIRFEIRICDRRGVRWRSLNLEEKHAKYVLLSTYAYKGVEKRLAAHDWAAALYTLLVRPLSSFKPQPGNQRSR